MAFSAGDEAFLNIESKGGQQPRDDRKLREIIARRDDDFKSPLFERRNTDTHGRVFEIFQ